MTVAEKIVFDLTAPPSKAEREHLDVRVRRLYDAEDSYKKATANLAALAKSSTAGSPVANGLVWVRDAFVFRSQPAPGDWSDRKLPPKEFCPPAGRLVTPRGAALRLMLIALFEAQTRTKPGRRPDNPRPLQAAGDQIAWADLLATDAKPSGEGRTYMSISDKKRRHLFSALDLMSEEDLVSLPNGKDRKNKHNGFLLNHESGKRISGPNEPYAVPLKRENNYFGLPLGLFTQGWIHVLEDRDLRYLLMLSYFHHGMPDGFQVMPKTRLLHMGLGPDTYEKHIWFTRFGLNEVTMDKARHFNGTVDDYGKGGRAIPHTLRLLPDGFEQDALKVVSTAIEDQLAR
ncbi:hypothetical protein [Micromonospora inositola]|uniref:hypothetical protein n=1 Tax=Micromonospora inositola TaxID=47865 RepID=UPI000B5AE46F|nr:hypothetical protein [Micromonospora inositola]